MINPIHVLVVEDDPGFLERYCATISSASDMRLQAGVGSLSLARQHLAHTLPNVIIVDLGLPDGDGNDLIREIYARDRHVDIMVVTVFWDERHIVRA